MTASEYKQTRGSLDFTGGLYRHDYVYQSVKKFFISSFMECKQESVTDIKLENLEGGG